MFLIPQNKKSMSVVLKNFNNAKPIYTFQGYIYNSIITVCNGIFSEEIGALPRPCHGGL